MVSLARHEFVQLSNLNVGEPGEALEFDLADFFDQHWNVCLHPRAEVHAPKPAITGVVAPLQVTAFFESVDHLADGGAAHFKQTRELRLGLPILAIEIRKQPPARAVQSKFAHTRIKHGAHQAGDIRERESDCRTLRQSLPQRAPPGGGARLGSRVDHCKATYYRTVYKGTTDLYGTLSYLTLLFSQIGVIGLQQRKRKMSTKRGFPPSLLALGLWFALAPGARAQDRGVPAPSDQSGTLTFVWENDSFADTDQNYTNGVRLAWLSGTSPTRGLSRFIARRVLNAGDDAVIRRGIAVGHSLFTPTDTQTSAPLPDQQPYAAWLYGEYTAVVEQRREIDQFTIQVGVVGPSAGGEWLQNEFHALIGASNAKGWDNQLDDEIGLVVSYDTRLRALASFGSNGLGADLTPNVGVTLGNIHTNLHAGLTLRVGQDLANDYGPPRVQPSLAGAGYFSPRDNFSWYVFAGVEGRAVAHNIFLDGSLFREDDPSVSSNSFVTDVQTGLVMQFRQAQVAFTYVERAEEFAEQTEPQRFGAVSLSTRF